MDCKTVQQSINDFLDQSLTSDALTAFNMHVNACKQCKAIVEKEQQIVSSLKQLPVVGPSANFKEQVFASLNHNSNINKGSAHRVGFVKGFSTAIAAGLALWVVVGILPFKNQDQDDVLPTIAINLQQVQTVKLAFHTVKAVENAKLTLKLPAHVELVGYEGLRELTWNTKLKQGDNLLKLPVRARAIAEGKIFAEIEHENKIKTFSFNVQIKNTGATMEPFRLNVV